MKTWGKAAVAAALVAATLSAVGQAPASAQGKTGPHRLTGRAACHYGTDGNLDRVSVDPAKVSINKKLALSGKKRQWVGWSADLQGQTGGSNGRWTTIADHGGPRDITLSVKTKPHVLSTIPSAADSSQLTFYGTELGSGYTAYRVQVTLKWYATRAKPKHNPKVRGKVVGLATHYALSGGSAAYPLQERASEGSCVGSLRAQPTVKVATFASTLPAVNSNVAVSGLTAPVTATVAAFRAGSEQEARDACHNPAIAPSIAVSQTVGNGTTPVNLSIPGAWLGWYAVRVSLPQTPTTAAAMACSDSAAVARYALSTSLVVVKPGTNGTGVIAPGSTLKIGSKIDLQLRMAGYTSTFLDGTYTVQYYKYTAKALCTANSQADKTQVTSIDHLSPTKTVSDTIGAQANAGKYFYRAEIYKPGGGLQPAVQSNCVGPYTWQ